MGNSILDSPSPERALNEHLDSWKEIAAYLNRDVTTVQRWEKREGMPVHRHLHDKRGSVYAVRVELDAWRRSRNIREREEHVGPSESPAVSTLSQARPSWKPLVLPAGIIVALAIGAWLWIERTEYFWRNPLEGAKFQAVTDFAGQEKAAAVSRDGNFIAFLSDRDGQMDVWITQTGSGQFHNLTRGSAPELANPSLRTLGFSPDGSFVTYWVRRPGDSRGSSIGIWAVPTLGGEPRPYLDGAAECDWSPDGSRLAYHTPGPGDPLFVSDGSLRRDEHPIFTAPLGLHAHFPSWSPDAKFIYFVQGSIPDKMDIWRIPVGGGSPERITWQNTHLIYPILLNRRTLMYLATDADGAGPWLYSLDVERRIPHRLGPGLEHYSSLAITADRHRLVATLASQKKTLWRVHMSDSPTKAVTEAPARLTTGAGFFPRLGQDFLLYVSATGTGESLWKLTGETRTELWLGRSARVTGGPAISPDGLHIAFTTEQQGQTLLYVIQADGTNPRVITNSLNLQGDPAWTPDGHSITSAVMESGVPHLFRIPIDGGAPAAMTQEYSLNPAWAPDGRFLVYSGPDIGTSFSVKAVAPDGAPHSLPAITLTRGARHVAFLPGRHALVVLRGELQHKNLWLIDLQTGIGRQLTDFPADFDIQDFDISPDGHEVVLEREEESSDVVLMDLPLR